jgi:hypothetical protein
VGDLDVGDHRAALLGQAGLVEADDVLAFEARGVGQGGHHGHRAGAADAHHVDADADGVVDLVDGLGQLALEAGMRPFFFFLRAVAGAGFGVMVRKDGQKPFTQEKSLLQDDWWMRVLRPNSVWTGSTLMQLDFSPQSPQPSQTRSLMTVTSTGSSALPRLRARRSSAAHSWSWISTVVPGVAASSFWASSRRSRCHDLGVAGQLDAGVHRQVVGGDDDLAHAVGEQVGDHVGHRVGALDGLAAGHRGVRVDQQLEGDVDVGGRA